ncbi:MAG: hypothetical protein QM401_05350 [Bacillota bacterium]|nr:hypothetical protein [Bacillota bacterium]
MEKHNRKVSYWLEIAEYDLVTARQCWKRRGFYTWVSCATKL